MAERLTVAQADLVAAHHEVASHAAIQAHWRWPRTDPADLLSWAYEGLIDAAITWDPDAGMTFVGYARQIVRRRIIDGWRREKTFRRQARPDVPLEVEVDGEWVERPLPVDEPGFDRVTDAVAAASIVARMPPMPAGAGRASPASVMPLIGAGLTASEVAGVLEVDPSRVSQVFAEARVAARGLRPRARRCSWVECRRSFVPARGQEPEPGRIRPAFCSPGCRLASDAADRRPSAKNCQWCRSLFRPKRNGGTPQRFCSSVCCHAAYNAAHPPRNGKRTA